VKRVAEESWGRSGEGKLYDQKRDLFLAKNVLKICLEPQKDVCFIYSFVLFLVFQYYFFTVIYLYCLLTSQSRSSTPISQHVLVVKANNISKHSYILYFPSIISFLFLSGL
jgi:hypothetical protein